MRILWVTNILPYFLAEKLNTTTLSTLGWLDYSKKMISKCHDVKLSVLFPSDEFDDGQDDIQYYTFPTKYLLHRDDDYLVSIIKRKITKASPDVIHVWGTEFFHSYACVKAAEELGLLDHTVVSIQGLVSVIAKHFLAGLPCKTTRLYTFRDLLKHENIIGQRDNLCKRGKGEVDALRITHNVIGRTEWDRACTKQINPNRTYFNCNETLRETFYDGETWNYDACEKHSIFVSQSLYALKGLHMMIEALPQILQHFPDATVYVTGNNVFNQKWYRIDSYHYYLKKLLLKYRIKDHVVFLGTLDKEQMKSMYLRSNVFVSCSSIENSPNSLGEAMILGVPCIASDVGGVSSLFKHNEDGYLYPFNEPYMLAYYICKMFEDEKRCSSFGETAKKHAWITHEPFKNANVLIKIYRKLYSERIDED